MKYTTNLGLPIFDKPTEDRFRITEWNEANETIDRTYGVLKLFSDELPSVNANAELVEARCGHSKLGELTSKLKNLSKNIVSVLDYSNLVINGDWTNAFIEAFKNAPCVVTIPSGTFNFKYIKIPSNCMLIGNGKNTILNAIKNNNSTNLVTNIDYTNGNENIVIKNLTIIGNKLEATPANGFCSGLTMANVNNALIENVKIIDPSLHCFDAMADKPYQLLNPSYSNNATYDVSKRSRFIYFVNCEGYGAGDDTFTCHYSDYIYFINCRAYENKSELAGSDNRNGFEVDDGSKNVYIRDCYANKNARGYEIKAHDHSPAPENVILDNCVADECVIGFNPRHLGHHLATEPITNGNNVTLNNCFCINPKVKSGIPLDAQALQISAFKNVVVNNFTAIGNENSISNSRPVITCQYKANNVTFNNLTINGFKASEDLYIVGATQKADNIVINGYNSDTKSNRGIVTGSEITNVTLRDINISGSNAEGQIGIRTYSNGVNISNSIVNNTPIKYNLNGMQMNELNNKTLLWSGNAYSANTTITTTNNIDYYDYLMVEVSYAGQELKLIDFKSSSICYIKGINLGNSLDPILATLIEMKLTKVDGNNIRLDFNYVLDIINKTIAENNSNYYISKIYGIKL